MFLDILGLILLGLVALVVYAACQTHEISQTINVDHNWFDLCFTTKNWFDSLCKKQHLHEALEKLGLLKTTFKKDDDAPPTPPAPPTASGSSDFAKNLQFSFADRLPEQKPASSKRHWPYSYDEEEYGNASKKINAVWQPTQSPSLNPASSRSRSRSPLRRHVLEKTIPGPFKEHLKKCKEQGLNPDAEPFKPSYYQGASNFSGIDTVDDNIRPKKTFKPFKDDGRNNKNKIWLTRSEEIRLAELFSIPSRLVTYLASLSKEEQISLMQNVCSATSAKQSLLDKKSTQDQTKVAPKKTPLKFNMAAAKDHPRPVLSGSPNEGDDPASSSVTFSDLTVPQRRNLLNTALKNLEENGVHICSIETSFT